MKFTNLSVFLTLTILLVASNIPSALSIKSNAKASELLKVKLELAQLNKLRMDQMDINNLQQQMNMVSAFFHVNNQQLHENNDNQAEHDNVEASDSHENKIKFSQTATNATTNATSAATTESTTESTTAATTTTATNTAATTNFASKFAATTEAATATTSSNEFGSLVGPRGQLCTSTEDCEQKNKDFYRYLKQKLLGENAASGEQGPQGEKGPQGLKGEVGPKGKDGVQPTVELLTNITKQIVQDELYKTAQGGIAQIEYINNQYVLDKLYYFGAQNCSAERNTYIAKCQADLYTDCSNLQGGTDYSGQCCPSQDCVSAIDSVACCLNRYELDLTELEYYDLAMKSTWLPLLKDIDYYQAQYIQQKKITGTSMLSEYKDRLNHCIYLGFRTDQMQCSIRQGTTSTNSTSTF